MDIIKELEDRQMQKIAEKRTVPDFAPGDTLRVKVRVVEGERERLQSFEGVCIGRSNNGLNSSFTVRKISYGEGVERVFPLHSPAIAEVEVLRRGNVRRAKLYYLRGRAGKKARITEKTDFLAEGAGAGAAAEADTPKAKAKPKKKKHDIEVPVTGEAPPENLEELVAEASAAAGDEETDAKSKKKAKKKADADANKGDKKAQKKGKDEAKK